MHFKRIEMHIVFIVSSAVCFNNSEMSLTVSALEHVALQHAFLIAHLCVSMGIFRADQSSLFFVCTVPVALT